MKPIRINEKLRPFSHRPGTISLLPGTPFRFQIFPALVRVYDLTGMEPVFIEEIPLEVEGPVQGFTVQLDLERGEIVFWGLGRQGYFRKHILKNGAGYLVADCKGAPLPAVERLSFGVHKKQDWELVRRRADLAEILPIWHRLGVLTPDQPNTVGGTADLLKDGSLEEHYWHLFLTGFEGLLSPRLADSDYQGFHLSEPVKGTPLYLLKAGARLIREQLIRFDGSSAVILPNVFPGFHAGKFTGVHWEGVGFLDLEWSKKQIRRAVLHADHDAEVALSFSQGIKRFRLNRGEIISGGAAIPVQENSRYIFDRFSR